MGISPLISVTQNYEGQPTLLGDVSKLMILKAWLQKPETIQAKALFIVSRRAFCALETICD